MTPAIKLRWVILLQAVIAVVAFGITTAHHPQVHYVLDGIPPPAGVRVDPVDTTVNQGRPADQLHRWALHYGPHLHIPITAMEAYGYAARVAEVVNPTCHIDWTTLAAIGQVESHHGLYNNATLLPNGDVVPPIRGIRLDGSGNTMRIIDDNPDEGSGVNQATQAMGPMQFIPQTWRLFGVDANNDGIINQDNIDDAALSAAGYLCWNGKNLATAQGWLNAIMAYNHSYAYARTIRNWATSYATDSKSITGLRV